MNRRPWAVAAALALAGPVGLLGLVLPASPARAEDPEPFARSATTTYRVTFAARACASFADVMANQVRDNGAESPGRPGRDSVYKPGQAVDPRVEEGVGCEAMTGVSFTLGAGREKKGALSTVTGAGTPVTTLAETPALDATGNPSGGPLLGSVTVTLTEEQMNLAGKRQLWAQGGTPAATVPGGHSFAALRCGIDGRTGGNTQWIGYLPGTRHTFCYAYYVRGAAATATVNVKLRTTRAAGYPQRIPFASSLSQGGSFALTADSSEATFVRLSGEAYRITPQLPFGWSLDDVSCAASKQVVDVGTGQADVTPVAGENVTCAYAVTPPVAPAGLTLRAYAEGGGTTFGVVVGAGSAASPSPGTSPGTGGSGGSAAPDRTLTVAPKGDGSAATATGADLGSLPPGQYRVTLNPPAAEAALWTVAGAACNGSPVRVEGRTAQVTVGAGAVADCVLRVVRRQGSVSLRVVTEGSVATAAYSVVPAKASDPGWAASATTVRPATAAPAGGDVPGSLPFGSYLVVPVAPLSTVDAAWTLTSLGCTPGTSGGPETLAVQVDLTAAAASVECTATYAMVRTAELRVNLQLDGGGPSGAGAIVLEVGCADGSAGRVVLGAGADGSADLPDPLVFAADTSCTVKLSDDTERPVNASLVNESAAGNAPLPLPATVAVKVGDGSASAAPGAGDLRLAVTLGYDGPGRGGRDRSSPVESFGFLPVALIGSGLIGIGAAVLLVLVARRRMGLD